MKIGDGYLLPSIVDFSDITEIQQGKTGSKTVTKDGKKYQFKFSILKKPKGFWETATKEIWGNHDNTLDTENFRELIAAKIVKAVVSSDRKHLVPNVNFAIDTISSSSENRIALTSEWLEPATKNETITHGGEIEETVVEIPPETKRIELSNCLAEFMLVANHDCNKGNFIQSKMNMGAIDYGKSFNALLNGPITLGGQVRNKSNQILDYLNREELPSTHDRTPKLWQREDLASLVPSKELAEAMEAMATDAQRKIAEGITIAKKEFYTLLKSNINKAHILKSLAEVANNLGGPEIKINLEKPDDTINEAFARIEAFSNTQAQSMAKAAHLMHAQVELDEILKSQNFDKQQLETWTTKYSSLIGENKNNKITWIKASKDTPAVVGTVRDYIKASEKRLGLDQQKLDIILLNTDLLPKTGYLSNLMNRFRRNYSNFVTTTPSKPSNTVVSSPRKQTGYPLSSTTLSDTTSDEIPTNPSPTPSLSHQKGREYDLPSE